MLLPADAVSKAISVQGVTSAPGPVKDNEANGGKARSCEYFVNGTPVLINFTGPAKATPEMLTPLVKAALAAS